MKLGSLLLGPALVVVGSLVAGFLLGYPLAALSTGLAVYLGWLLSQLWRLNRWLATGAAPEGAVKTGIWGNLYARFQQIRRDSSGSQKSLRSVVRAFRKSADALPDGIIVLDDQQQVIWDNRAAVELLGLRGAADHGRHISDLISQPKFSRFIRQGDRAEPLIIKRGGKPKRRLSLQLIPYGDNQEILVVRDITRAQQIEKMRRDFVANVSHELRTPLTVIAGYVDEMLTDQALVDSWGTQLDTIMNQAERMKAIVTDLLRLSRLESADTEAEFNPVDVLEMLHSIRRETVARYSNSTSIIIDVDQGATLLGDHQQLYSAFSNLVDNAVKYSGDAGEVSVRFRVDYTGARLVVADSGPGILPKHIPRLTERFYRVDKGRDRERGGTGLGLAIVKHVLQRHGAILTITSSPGEGSRFTCDFPASRVASPDIRASAG